MALSPGAAILKRNAVHMRQSNVLLRIGLFRFLSTAPVPINGRRVQVRASQQRRRPVKAIERHPIARPQHWNTCLVLCSTGPEDVSWDQ